MTKNVFFPKEILNDIIKGEFKYRGGFAGLDWKSDSLRVYGRIILQQFLPQAIAKKKMHISFSPPKIHILEYRIDKNIISLSTAN